MIENMANRWKRAGRVFSVLGAGLFLGAVLFATSSAADGVLVPFPGVFQAPSAPSTVAGGGGGIGGAGAAGQVTFFSAATTVAGDATLLWDGTTLTTNSFASTGATTFGNAAADTVTSNAAAWTFPSDTTVALGGGVNGLNFDANTLSIDASNNRVGIGTAAPGATLAVVAGSMPTLTNIISGSGTLPAGAAEENGLNFDVTTTGATLEHRRGIYVTLAAGGATGFATVAGQFYNTVTGTGTDPIGVPGTPQDNANIGAYQAAVGVTTGTNVGSRSTSSGGDANFGQISWAWEPKASAKNIGLLALGRNTAASPVQLGAYIGLDGALPTFTSAALMVDNSDRAAPILVLRDNGTAVFTVADGGNVTATGVFLGPEGSAAAPSYSFASDPDSGIYHSFPGPVIHIALNGVDVWQMGTGSATTTELLRGPAGTAAQPTYSFATDQNTGAHLSAVGTYAITVNSADALTVKDEVTGSTIGFSGHLESTGAAATNLGTGSCTAVTVTGTDARGSIVATCLLGQTVVIGFASSATYSAAPACVVSAASATAVTGSAHLVSTIAGMTLTSTAATGGAATWKYICIG